MKKNKWQKFIFAAAVLITLFLLNSLSSRKSPSEKVKELVSQHRGAIVFVKSNTTQDGEFISALKEARAEMKGKGGVIVCADATFLEGQERPPALIIYDSHGNILTKISGTLDKELLMKMAHSLATHSH